MLKASAIKLSLRVKPRLQLIGADARTFAQQRRLLQRFIKLRALVQLRRRNQQRAVFRHIVYERRQLVEHSLPCLLAALAPKLVILQNDERLAAEERIGVDGLAHCADVRILFKDGNLPVGLVRVAINVIGKRGGQLAAVIIILTKNDIHLRCLWQGQLVLQFM